MWLNSRCLDFYCEGLLKALTFHEMCLFTCHFEYFWSQNIHFLFYYLIYYIICWCNKSGPNIDCWIICLQFFWIWFAQWFGYGLTPSQAPSLLGHGGFFGIRFWNLFCRNEANPAASSAVTVRLFHFLWQRNQQNIGSPHPVCFFLFLFGNGKLECVTNWFIIKSKALAFTFPSLFPSLTILSSLLGQKLNWSMI